MCLKQQKTTNLMSDRLLRALLLRGEFAQIIEKARRIERVSRDFDHVEKELHFLFDAAPFKAERNRRVLRFLNLTLASAVRVHSIHRRRRHRRFRMGIDIRIRIGLNLRVLRRMRYRRRLRDLHLRHSLSLSMQHTLTMTLLTVTRLRIGTLSPLLRAL